VRPHLEHANSVCVYIKRDIVLVEKVQKKATKLIKYLKHLPYMERLKQLKLPTLKYRQLLCQSGRKREDLGYGGKDL